MRLFMGSSWVHWYEIASVCAYQEPHICHLYELYTYSAISTDESRESQSRRGRARVDRARWRILRWVIFVLIHLEGCFSTEIISVASMGLLAA